MSDLRQAPGRTKDAVAAHHERGVAGMGEAADRSAQAETAWTADATQRANSGTTEFAGTAERLAGDARQTNVQRLLESLIGPMRSWLQRNLGNVLGGIVSGIILSLPTIIITAILLFSGPVGWAVLIGLLIVGAAFGIYARFSEYSADHGGQGPSVGEGFALVGLGILDITGLPYIVEAIAGRRAFAPRPMSEFEQWERGTQGVISLLAIAAGGAKKLFGKGGAPTPGRGPAPGRIAPPGERAPTETPPVERPPTETLPGERPPAIAADGTPATPNTQCPGPHTLTAAELSELQAIATRFRTTLWVIGSRGRGAGRNIETNLPVGDKGPGTRSDIDVMIDGQVDIDTRGGLSGTVSGSCKGVANVASSRGSPSGEFITISPQGEPAHATVPGSDTPTIPPPGRAR
jgi:hypothetical protein